MSFIAQEPFTFLNIKLTDNGRKMMALGNFTMSKVILLDREMDYTIDNNGGYNIFNNRVIEPPDFYPDIDTKNLDGSHSLALGYPKITTKKQVITASTQSRGMFTGELNNWTLDDSLTLGYNDFNLPFNTPGTNRLTSIGGSYTPVAGDLLFMAWCDDAAADYFINSNDVLPLFPVLTAWFRVLGTDSGDVIIDRMFPNVLPLGAVRGFYYPSNGIETTYGTGSTQNTLPWNLNIVRTNDVMGMQFPTGVSGSTDYKRYGSIEYAGTKKYFGFSSETIGVGFIHYTNKNTGNTYAEQLVERTVEVHIPMIMWHHSGQDNTKGTYWGISMYDNYGPTHYDPYVRSSYRELKDSQDSSGFTVGRVYHKLKTIVITDQELLTAMSYKSNRNYTLPDFNLELTDKPNVINSTVATGLCNSGYTYFVSYIPLLEEVSFGVAVSMFDMLPCQYIKKIEGEVDEFGNPKFLNISFPNPNSFPYLREQANWDSIGWSAKGFQILINEQPSEYNYNVSDVPSDGWRRISDNTIGGNGCYIDVSGTADGRLVNQHSFILSREDYVSGSTYVNSTGITYGMETLNFGDETFFHGVVNTDIMSTSYKSSIMVTAKSDTINSSLNPTFSESDHQEVFITEVLVLDESDQVVAVGKPTYPVKKRSGKYIGFQLEIDF